MRAVAFTQGVPEAIQARDTRQLTSLVRPIAANAAVERVEVLDERGGRLTALRLADTQAVSYEAVLDTDAPAEWPLVEGVLQGQADDTGDKYAQIIDTNDGLVLWTSGPVFADSGQVGAVLVGTSLGSFVKQTKAEALADVTIYDFEGAPLASTFAVGAASGEEGNLDMAPAVLVESIEGNAVREKRSLFSRNYDLLYGRLEVRDQVVGLYSVGLPTDFIFNAGKSTRTQVMLLFGAGMAAVLGIGLYLTHQLTKPILRLVRTARIVASGDLTVRSGVKSGDEIGILATSFDE